MTTPLNPTTAVVPAPKREIRVVEDDSPLAFIMDTAKFEHCYRIAEAMGRASLIPKHLKGGTKEETAANCFLVVNQALRWHMDPFSIAPETYEVQGKLGYQGKLIAAVINTRAGLAEKLKYVFTGKKGTDDFTVTVSGRFEGEAEPRLVDVSVGQAKTQNQMWTKDPEQKLVYTGSIRWARRHAPEVIMGVMTDDDLDVIREQAMIDNMKMVKTPALLDNVPLPISSERGNPEPPPEPKKRNKRTLVEQPLDQPTPPVQAEPATNPEVPSPSPVPTAAPLSETKPEAPEAELLRVAAANGINQEQLTKFLYAEHFLGKGNPPKTKITEISSSMLANLASWFKQSDFVKRVMEAK